MAYEVKDTHHKIVITLDAKSNVLSKLRLRTFVNGLNTVHSPIYFPQSGGKFIIDMADFTVGDIITKIEFIHTSSPYLWQTQEGVQILINGVNMNLPLTHVGTTTPPTATFKYDFTDTGKYDIQCVYVGNGANQFAQTEKKNFIISQSSASQEGGSTPSQSNGYTLDFVKKTTPKVKYGEDLEIKMILKKDGQPAPNRVVQCVEGDKNIDEHGTRTTNTKGIVKLHTKGVDAGTWDFGAFYYDEVRRKVIKKYRKVTIEKLTAKMTDNFVADKSGNDTNFIKGSKYVVTLKLGKELLKDQPVDMFINGKKTPLKTDKNGTVAYAFKTKDTYKIKTVFKGTTNIGAVELSRSITISE